VIVSTVLMFITEKAFVLYNVQPQQYQKVSSDAFQEPSMENSPVEEK